MVKSMTDDAAQDDPSIDKKRILKDLREEIHSVYGVKLNKKGKKRKKRK